jgi:hypothetical protein
MLQSLKRKAPLGPGSRDGLTSTRSGMTVGEMRESCAGKPHALRGRLCLVFANTSVSAPVRGLAQRLSRCLPCHGGGVMRGPSQDASHPSDREAGLPAHAEAFTRSGNCRERNKRKHGPLRFAPYLYFIGAPLSGPSGGDCTLPRSPGLDSGRTALLGLRFVPLTRAHVPPVRSPLRWGGLTGRRVVTLASPPARKDLHPSEPPRMLPVRKHQGCAVRDPSGPGRCRVPVRSDTGRYSRTSFTKPSGLTSKTGTRAVSSSEAGDKDYSLY